MLLKHNVGCFLFFFLLGSTVLVSIFAGFNMFQFFLQIFLLLCGIVLLLCNYKMLLKHKVGCFFSFFAGFNCLDFYIRGIQHVLVFLQFFLLLCGIVCCCVTTRCY